MKGIRLSGPPLGRSSKKDQSEQKRIAQMDSAERNAVVGNFGEGKRHHRLGLIQARLPETSEAVIALQFLVMNLERRIRLLFRRLSNDIFYLKVKMNQHLFNSFSTPYLDFQMKGAGLSEVSLK